MDLSLTAEQNELRRVARSFFAAQHTLEVARRTEGRSPGYSEEVFHEMARLDWLRLGHSADVGGMGGLVDLAVLYDEMGWALVDTPHLESGVVAGAVLAAGAGNQMQTALLQLVLAGKELVVVALAEPPRGSSREAGMRVQYERDFLRLSGTKILVPYADRVSHFIVPAETLGTGTNGLTLVIVEANAAGVVLRPMPNLAGAPLFEVRFDVVLTHDHVVGGPNEGEILLALALERGAVLRAAQIAGAGRRLLDMAVDYANTREQFDAPIGQYQAVQYLCTDIAIDAHLSWMLALYAAGLADEARPIAPAAAHAKAYASRAARRMAHRTHEVFAGVAFMVECDVQLFTRRLKHWELDVGDARAQRQTIARLIESASPRAKR